MHCGILSNMYIAIVIRNSTFTCCIISDDDECIQLDVCENGYCINSEGTFTCVCDNGYVLTGDGRTCTGRQLLIM